MPIKLKIKPQNGKVGTFINSRYEILFVQIYGVVLYKTIPLIKYCDFQKVSEEIGGLGLMALASKQGFTASI
jgi:hypothetical protein